MITPSTSRDAPFSKRGGNRVDEEYSTDERIAGFSLAPPHYPKSLVVAMDRSIGNPRRAILVVSSRVPRCSHSPR